MTRSTRSFGCAAILAALCGCGAQRAESARVGGASTGPGAATASAAVPHNDYARPDAWLCRPGRQDACAVDLTATVIGPDGKLSREEWKANPGAPIDCFYVYPTVSQDPTPNSDMQPGPEERRAVELQFARFGSVCRLYAPMYRQVTLAGLRDAIRAGKLPDWSSAYGDVVDAWTHYLGHDNAGRGVVLIGHSQGSRHLIQLLHEAIEGKPVQRQIVSALIPGANFTPPPATDTASRLPPCASTAQTGCVISYVSFRESSPPPDNARFGRTPAGVTCTNPAALGGGPAELDAYLSTRATLVGPARPFQWTKDRAPVSTPFVRVPGLVSAQCVTKDGATYLSISTRAEPGSARTDDIPGDLVVNGAVLRDWGRLSRTRFVLRPSDFRRDPSRVRS